jgi:hypothetical protein
MYPLDTVSFGYCIFETLHSRSMIPLEADPTLADLEGTELAARTQIIGTEKSLKLAFR